MYCPKDEACLQAVSFHRLANPETYVCEVRWLRPERPVMVSLGVLPAAGSRGAIECPQGPKPPSPVCFREEDGCRLTGRDAETGLSADDGGMRLVPN